MRILIACVSIIELVVCGSTLEGFGVSRGLIADSEVVVNLVRKIYVPNNKLIKRYT